MSFFDDNDAEEDSENISSSFFHAFSQEDDQQRNFPHRFIDYTDSEVDADEISKSSFELASNEMGYDPYSQMSSTDSWPVQQRTSPPNALSNERDYENTQSIEESLMSEESAPNNDPLQKQIHKTPQSIPTPKGPDIRNKLVSTSNFPNFNKSLQISEDQSRKSQHRQRFTPSSPKTLPFKPPPLDTGANGQFSMPTKPKSPDAPGIKTPPPPPSSNTFGHAAHIAGIPKPPRAPPPLQPVINPTEQSADTQNLLQKMMDQQRSQRQDQIEKMQRGAPVPVPAAKETSPRPITNINFSAQKSPIPPFTKSPPTFARLPMIPPPSQSKTMLSTSSSASSSSNTGTAHTAHGSGSSLQVKDRQERESQQSLQSNASTLVLQTSQKSTREKTPHSKESSISSSPLMAFKQLNFQQREYALRESEDARRAIQEKERSEILQQDHREFTQEQRGQDYQNVGRKRSNIVHNQIEHAQKTVRFSNDLHEQSVAVLHETVPAYSKYHYADATEDRGRDRDETRPEESYTGRALDGQENVSGSSDSISIAFPMKTPKEIEQDLSKSAAKLTECREVAAQVDEKFLKLEKTILTDIDRVLSNDVIAEFADHPKFSSFSKAFGIIANLRERLEDMRS